MTAGALRGLCTGTTAAVVLWLGASTGRAQTWQVVPGSPYADYRFDDIKFADRNVGWIVSTDHRILGTRDGGLTWTLQVDTADVVFRSLAVFDRNHVFAGTVRTSPHPLWESRDGGVTWHDATWRIIGPRPSGICGMRTIDEYTAVGVGAFHGDPMFIKTLNGGSEWYSRSMSDVAGALIDVWFRDALVGIAVGGTGANLDGQAVIVRTDDGGATWRRVYESTRDEGIRGEWAWKISFPTDDVGYVSVEFRSGSGVVPAKVLKTTDGGLTWTAITIEGSVEPAGLQGIGFRDEQTGWASGRGTTSMTTDGGATWTQISHYEPNAGAGQLDGNVNRFLFLDDSLAFAVGHRVYRMVEPGMPTSAERAGERPALPFSIGSAFPNPTDGPVTLPIELDRDHDVRVLIIDLLGRPVRALVRERLSEGRHLLPWDGRRDDGSPVSPGTYIALFDVGTATEMKQVLIVR